MDGDFNDSEDVDEEEEDDPQSMMKAGSKKDGSDAKGAAKEIQGEKLKD